MNANAEKPLIGMALFAFIDAVIVYFANRYALPFSIMWWCAVLSAGCAIPTEDLETSLLPNEAFENVLLNQRRFSYTDSNSNPIYQSNVYLSEIAAEDQSTMSLPKFAVVDMDGDELPEVVYQRGDYMGFIVLRYKDGDIYGYDVNYRGLTGLKKDGSYSMSGGSSNTSVGKMRFLGKLFDTDIKFSSVEQESVSYYLNGKEINEVTFNQLRDEYKKLPDVDWHEYTESAVKECLPSYFEAQEVAISYEHHSTPMQDYLDSLSDLLYNDHSIHGDNTEDEYDAIFQSSYNGWEHAMVTIYTLCQSKLTGSAKDVLETEQQQWLDMREQAALDTPIFLVTDMTKMRTYDLISFLMITFTIDTFSELNREDGRIHPAVAVRLNHGDVAHFFPCVALNGQSIGAA